MTFHNWKSERRSVVSDSSRPHGLYSPWNSPGQNTGVSSLSLLQGIFWALGLNPGLPHCGRILYQLSHRGSLKDNLGSSSIWTRDPLTPKARIIPLDSESPLWGFLNTSSITGSLSFLTAFTHFSLHSWPCNQSIFCIYELWEGNGNPLQYSCLENPMDRRAWWATVHGVTKSQVQPSD